MDRRKRELAKIHIAIKELGLDEGAYRALLRRVAGVESARDLDALGRARVLDELRRSGWRSRPPGGGRAQDNSPQTQKIRALWLDLYDAGLVANPSDRALNAWVYRMTGIADLRWVDADQRRQLIEALKKWRQRIHEGQDHHPASAAAAD